MKSKAPLSILLLLPVLLGMLQGECHQPLRRSKRRWVITTLELEEEDPGPFPKFVGELFNNMSENMTLMYLISGPGVDEYPEVGLFSIEDHETGKIYVHRSVDRETTPSFMVYFNVADRSTGKIVDKSLLFNIRIRDINDHAPRFPQQEFNISVKENQAAGQPFFQMSTVDLDQKNTPNSQVLYFLVSQTPSPKESAFRIDRLSGEIQLSGCLDYETAPRFTLLIRARDCGEPSLSSTATVHIDVREGNNHLPVLTQETYNIQISEGQVIQGLLRLPVQDRDSPLTPAWRVQFNIAHGNEEGNFDIQTDPEANEGVLNVIKPLDYETHPVRSLVITVENEDPLFSCEGGELRQPRVAVASATVSVQVMDANDPPAFHPESFVVSKEEGARPGTQLGTFNAVDPDKPASRIRYKLVHDPAHWVAIDENSGAVTTTKPIDRESPHVNDSFYTVIVHAVDDALKPHSRYMEVCDSARIRSLLVEAEDPDLEPYSAPFTFELVDTWGNAEDTWKLGTNWGRSVELAMLRSLPHGNYSVPLIIGDRQGISQKQTVHVRLCSCLGGVTCVEPLGAGAESLTGVLLAVCGAFMALAVALLLLLRCYFASEPGRRRFAIPSDEGHQTLILYNEESKASPAQTWSDVTAGMPALPVHTATVGAKLGAKDLNDVPPSTVVSSDQAHSTLGTPVCLDGVVPRRLLATVEGRIAETLWQKLRGVDELEEGSSHRPHVYLAEGASEGALSSLSSLVFSEQELPPDLLDGLGPKSAQLAGLYSGCLSPRNAHSGELKPSM
ncbi:cadherin-like protein 26 isoform X3 [Nycticebus coucang]|uniref:cadherin-like protein 26 isoform X3 n=1 Tax=Nycticebus coucang TaxID=9470 RepID=UPI00234C9CC5|nr:cadherin-like protein 26 isoform X3 [Nycticebus coucang]